MVNGLVEVLTNFKDENTGISRGSRFNFLCLIIRALEIIYTSSIKTFTNNNRNSERLSALDRLFSFIGTYEEMPFIIETYMCNRAKTNIIDLKKRLGCNDIRLMNNISTAYENGDREEKRQILSFFYNTGYSYAQIKELFRSNSKHIVRSAAFYKVMTEIKNGFRQIGELVTETRNYFFIDKEDLEKLIYNFIKINSEPSSCKTFKHKYKGEAKPRLVIKGFQNKTALCCAFNKQMREVFGTVETEREIFRGLSQESKVKISEYRDLYKKFLEQESGTHNNDSPNQEFEDIDETEEDKSEVEKISIRNVISYTSFCKLFEKRDFKEFTFSDSQTDKCEICEESYIAIANLEALKNKPTERLTEEEKENFQILEKMILLGREHKEQNRFYKNQLKETIQNLKPREGVIMMDFKGINLFKLNN